MATGSACNAGGVVDDTAERLVRIETKLDIALTGQSDHETRIRSSETALATLANGETRLRRAEFGTVAAVVLALAAIGIRVTDIIGTAGLVGR